jgi:hypothetical protein
MADAAGLDEPRRRPAVVTAAVWLLYVVALCQVVYALVVVSQLGPTRDAFTNVFAGTQLEGSEDTMVAITAATAVGRSLLFAIGYVVLAVLDGRGKNPARIVTWVAAGLSICCSGADLVSSAISATSLGGNGGNGGPTNQQIQQALTAALPGWYQPVLSTTNLIAVAAVVTAVVLLALPIANGFFRKPQPPVWQPSVPQVPPATA